MCGIVGLWDLEKRYQSREIRSLVKRMCNTLESRGPDDGDVWIDSKDNFCLGHKRLSILEVSNLERHDYMPFHMLFACLCNLVYG